MVSSSCNCCFRWLICFAAFGSKPASPLGFASLAEPVARFLSGASGTASGSCGARKAAGLIAHSSSSTSVLRGVFVWRGLSQARFFPFPCFLAMHAGHAPQRLPWPIVICVQGCHGSPDFRTRGAKPAGQGRLARRGRQGGRPLYYAPAAGGALGANLGSTTAEMRSRTPCDCTRS